MEQQIDALLKIGAISSNNFTKGFISPIFLREKQNGSHRLIFNLKSLNNYVHYSKFRLINLRKVAQLIQKDDYLVKIDISNAYYHVPVADSHRRYLSFAFKDHIYNMNCLPFGLSSAPSIFSKISNFVASLLRKEGIRTIVYLDDFLLLNDDPVALQLQAKWVVNFLTKLGWHINTNKSTLQPQKRIEYLGLIWDSHQNKKMLPFSKVQNISECIYTILNKDKWNWMVAKQLLGKLNFASNAIPLGFLHCRHIQMAAKSLPDTEKRKTFQLPQKVREELLWWLQNLSMSSTIQIAPPSTFITTDASDLGWGATVNDKKLSGPWKSFQNHWHSNRKELWSLLEVLRGEYQVLRGKTVIFQSDNRTAIAYLRKQGGTKSVKLLNIAEEILNLAHRYQIQIIPKYLPGRYNGLADSLSRLKSHQEWHLSPHLQSIIFRKMGTPEIDLFATKRSTVVPRYVSEDHRDKMSEFTNAFSKTWKYRLAWIFAPPALIPQVLQHLNHSHGLYIMIVPKWERAFWRPEIKKRAVRPPLKLRNLKDHLVDLRTNLPPPMIRHLHLEAWKIRAGPLK